MVTPLYLHFTHICSLPALLSIGTYPPFLIIAYPQVNGVFTVGVSQLLVLYTTLKGSLLLKEILTDLFFWSTTCAPRVVLWVEFDISDLLVPSSYCLVPWYSVFPF